MATPAKQDVEFSSIAINYGTSTREIMFSWALVCLLISRIMGTEHCSVLDVQTT